jgi:signal transduction histidine kinase
MIPLRLRVRVTLAFVLATAVVLAALGGFLHARLASQLDATLTANLHQRGADLATLAESAQTISGLGQSGLIERGDDVSQVLDGAGNVVAGAPGLTRTALLTPDEVRRARRGPVTVPRRPKPGDGEAMRLLAVPAGGRIAVVGASLEDRNDVVRSLDRLLLLGLPAALLIAGLAGYAAAGGALRPVVRLSRQAERLGAGDLSRRMPVPAADDEVRRLADSLNAMLARVEETFARERAFVADASHELRTPLARLKAELDLAARGERTADELTDAVRSAAAETEELATLANDLLVLARADQGRLPIRPETLQARPLLEAAARRADVPVTVDVPADLTVHADPLRLAQAVGNLIDNAVRHGEPPIELRALARDGGVAIHVRDHGGGIGPELRTRAFERFTRGDEAREGGGAGLGLALVASIADAHGATVGIDDAGPGADVWLRLPVPGG